MLCLFSYGNYHIYYYRKFASNNKGVPQVLLMFDPNRIRLNVPRVFAGMVELFIIWKLWLCFSIAYLVKRKFVNVYYYMKYRLKMRFSYRLLVSFLVPIIIIDITQIAKYQIRNTEQYWNIEILINTENEFRMLP